MNANAFVVVLLSVVLGACAGDFEGEIEGDIDDELEDDVDLDEIEMSDNYIYNPGFSSPLASSYCGNNWCTSFAYRTTAARRGATGYGLRVPSFAYAMQAPPIAGSKTYVLSAYVKHRSGALSQSLRVAVVDASGNVLVRRSLSVGTSTAWHHSALSFSAPASARRAWIYIGDSGPTDSAADWDDISLRHY